MTPRDSDGERLRAFELGVFQRQPLDPDIAKVHLDASIATAPLRIDDDAKTELGMANALPYPPPRCAVAPVPRRRGTARGGRRVRRRNGCDARAPLRRIEVDRAACAPPRREPLHDIAQQLIEEARRNV